MNLAMKAGVAQFEPDLTCRFVLGHLLSVLAKPDQTFSAQSIAEELRLETDEVAQWRSTRRGRSQGH